VGHPASATCEIIDEKIADLVSRELPVAEPHLARALDAGRPSEITATSIPATGHSIA